MNNKRKSSNPGQVKSSKVHKHARTFADQPEFVAMEMRNEYKDPVFMEKLKNAYKDKEDVDKGTSTNIQLTQNPFCHCVIPNIIKDQDFVDRLQEEILDLTFSEKNNDLYKFHQSLEDLKVIESPLISRLR